MLAFITSSSKPIHSGPLSVVQTTLFPPPKPPLPPLPNPKWGASETPWGDVDPKNGEYEEGEEGVAGGGRAEAGGGGKRREFGETLNNL